MLRPTTIYRLWTCYGAPQCGFELILETTEWWEIEDAIDDELADAICEGYAFVEEVYR